MIHFLYGENTFLVKKYLKKLRENFLTKNDALNIIELDGSNLKQEIFASCVMTLPFLADKRLVVVKNLLIENSDQGLKKSISEILKKVPLFCELIFVEFGQPDARTALFKALNKLPGSKSFLNSNEKTVETWIVRRIEKEGLSISNAAKTKLQLYVGSDFWRMENEVLKLLLYQKYLVSKGEGVEISTDSVDKLVESSTNPNIFDFIEALANKNMAKASVSLHNLIQGGEHELKILSMIVYQYRTIISLFDLKSRGLNPSEIVSKTKIHPFVIKKNLSILRFYQSKDLLKIYQLLKDTDIKMKNGQLEARLALDILITKLCS